MNTPSPLTFAAIADVHGNCWALDAVLADVDRRGVTQLVNLGDCLTGPLDPASTADLLMSRGMPGVCGNDDRGLFAPAEELSPAQIFTRERLTPAHLEWLRTLPDTTVFADAVFLCHGDLFDAPYLLEEVSASGIVHLRSTPAIAASVAAIAEPLILCAHSHLPRTIALPAGKLIVNPGSVGLPAYTMDVPIPYAMESGSPHARYALLTRTSHSWQVEHVQVPYDWEHAAEVARGNQRSDWAVWLATGRAE
jgi:diadenosine tetraphosphatase ApaH/serine/threonine PP2A family protein phosphatase